MNTLELLQIYMHTIHLSQSVCFDLFLDNSKGQICTIMSSISLCCKTKTVLTSSKKQKNYCLLSFEKKIYSKNEHTFS